MMMSDKEMFEKYVRVQYKGDYNMLTRDAEKATGLTHAQYMRVLNNYNKFASDYPEVLDAADKAARKELGLK